LYSIETKHEACRQFFLSKLLNIKFQENSSSNIPAFICGGTNTEQTDLAGVFCCEELILLTYSMVQSPSSEANWFAASQEIPRISRNPEGSLPQSQASTTLPYPGPAQSSPNTHIPPPGDPS